jgi:hypothetical protein
LLVGDKIQEANQNERQASTGRSVSATFAMTGEGEGTPWLIYRLEEMVFNTDVSSTIYQMGS